MGFTIGEKLRGPVLPEGTYDVLFEDYVMAAMNDGTPLLKLRFKVINGEYAGQYVQDTVKVSSDGIWKACQILAALGMPDSTYYDSEESCATDVVRKLEAAGPLRVVVKHSRGRDPDRVFPNIVSYAPLPPEVKKEVKRDDDVPF